MMGMGMPVNPQDMETTQPPPMGMGMPVMEQSSFAEPAMSQPIMGVPSTQYNQFNPVYHNGMMDSQSA